MLSPQNKNSARKNWIAHTQRKAFTTIGCEMLINHCEYKSHIRAHYSLKIHSECAKKNQELKRFLFVQKEKKNEMKPANGIQRWTCKNEGADKYSQSSSVTGCWANFAKKSHRFHCESKPCQNHIAITQTHQSFVSAQTNQNQKRRNTKQCKAMLSYYQHPVYNKYSGNKKQNDICNNNV